MKTNILKRAKMKNMLSLTKDEIYVLKYVLKSLNRNLSFNLLEEIYLTNDFAMELDELEKTCLNDIIKKLSEI
ncbi:MAG: hypothetical protein LBJ63_12035 [Prevotellaceae bacterium]|jgi:hypothetical protein|nr:hypothetical protein [Prevotellaceae bacterium]